MPTYYIAKVNFDQRLVTVAFGDCRNFVRTRRTNDKIQLWTFSISAHIVCGFHFTRKNNSMRLNNVLKPFVPKL